MQSAYRKYHSTETALLRVQYDLLRAVDQHQDAVLILLDFSAAFDTIDHDILLHRLCQSYGITRAALKWFSSYLRGRTQCIDIGGVLSDERLLDEGVPQGSVFGPAIFTMYTAPLGDIITSHGLNHMMYADHTQLYLILDPSKRSEGLSRLERCVQYVKSWAVSNKLMLNESKTEVIHMSSRFAKTSSFPSLKIGDSAIDVSVSARNLGVIFDSRLDMKEHFKRVSPHLHHSPSTKSDKYVSILTQKQLSVSYTRLYRLDWIAAIAYSSAFQSVILPSCSLSRIQLTLTLTVWWEVNRLTPLKTPYHSSSCLIHSWRSWHS